MIAQISGKIRLVDLAENYLFVASSSGVSYQVFVSSDTALEAVDLNEISLYIYTVYKENDVQLYGFFTLDEREMFGLLLSIKGVGPQIAIVILSELPVEDIQKAVSEHNKNAFLQIKGIGETTATNIVEKLPKKEAFNRRFGVILSEDLD